MNYKDNPNYYSTERPYKSKYICTDCRKVFKRRVLTDITDDRRVEEKDPVCTDCGQPAEWIGLKFRAPKITDVQTWNSIKVLRDLRILHFIGWAHQEIQIPATQKALHDLLREIKTSYECSVKNWITADYSPRNKEEIKHLSEAIKKIEQYLGEN